MQRMNVQRVAVCSYTEPTVELMENAWRRNAAIFAATIRWWSVNTRTLRYAMESAYGVNIIGARGLALDVQARGVRHGEVPCQGRRLHVARCGV